MAQGCCTQSIQQNLTNARFSSHNRKVMAILFAFGGVKMLDKGMFVATNDLWMAWCSRLAEQAGRSRAKLLRDLIYLMIFDEELGDAITRRLQVEQISFSK